jgi:hypothetical protein
LRISERFAGPSVEGGGGQVKRSVLRDVQRAGNGGDRGVFQRFETRCDVASESRQWRSISEVVDEVLISVGREAVPVPAEPKRPRIPPRKLN